MSDFNQISIMGNLTADPLAKYKKEAEELPAGKDEVSLCSFSIASNRSRKTGEDEYKTETTYIDVIAFGKQATYIVDRYKKGTKVIVSGRLKLNSWEDLDGKQRRKHEIIAEKVTFISHSSQKKKQDQATSNKSSEDSEYVPF
tara:strand:+ start:712 stop:1140 length:429 start_codon:yes stop_codon:yes gene_type:complete